MTSAKAIAVIIKPLIDLFGMPRNWETAAPIYVSVLEDIPPEILQIAVRHALANCTFFPKPAELRTAVADELEDYRRRQATRIALPPPERPDAAAIRAEIRRQKQQEYREAALYREKIAHAEGYRDFASWFDRQTARWKTIISDSEQEERQKGAECPL